MPGSLDKWVPHNRRAPSAEDEWITAAQRLLERAELADAEVERLKDENLELDETCGQRQVRIYALEAEVERLLAEKGEAK